MAHETAKKRTVMAHKTAKKRTVMAPKTAKKHTVMADNLMFASTGPVWRDPRPLPADAYLAAFSKEDLRRMHDLEMDRRAQAGVPHAEARHLTTTWDAKRKEAFVEKLEALRADDITPYLVMPHQINEASVPTLAVGTLLVNYHGRHHDDRTYADVVGVTPAGRVKLRVRENVLIESTPPADDTATRRYRYRCAVGSRERAAFSGATELATFEPCERPGSVNAHALDGDNDHWTLRSGRNHAAFLKMWRRVAPGDVVDGAVEWDVHGASALD